MAITIHMTNDQAERALEAIAAALDATPDKHVKAALLGMRLQINDARLKRRRVPEKLST